MNCSAMTSVSDNHSPPQNTSAITNMFRLFPSLPEPPHRVSECSELRVCHGQTDSITDKSVSFSFKSPDNST